jgi:hypothetical protein
LMEGGIDNSTIEGEGLVLGASEWGLEGRGLGRAELKNQAEG